MVQILTPDYKLGAAYQPSPVAQGLAAFTTMQANRRANIATQSAQRLQALQAQKAQTELQYLPGALTTAQHQAELNARKQALANQASQMAYNNARTTIFQNRMADVAQTPANLQEQEFQDARKQYLAMGGDPKRIPATFSDPMAQHMAQEGLRKSPQMATQRKFQNSLLMQELKGHQLLAGVQAKVAGQPSAGAVKLAQQEATANSAYKSQVITDSGTAQNILADTDNIAASLRQSTSGYVGTLTNWDSKEGQLLKKNTADLVLARLQGMKHLSRASNMIMTWIKRSKPADWMKTGAIERITAGLAAISHRAMQKENFTQFMWDHGVVDRGKIDTLWNRYQQAYPLVDVNMDTVNTQNVGRWAEFLRNNRKMVDRMRGVKTPAGGVRAAPIAPTGQTPQGVAPTQASLLDLTPQQASVYGMGGGQ